MLPCGCPGRCVVHPSVCRCGHNSISHSQDEETACTIEGCECRRFVQRGTSAALTDAVSSVLPPEVCEDIAKMPLDEGLGYVFTLLIEQGEDPEEFLREQGILER